MYLYYIDTINVISAPPGWAARPIESGGHAVSAIVKSEITGKIWKIDASVGQSVGQDEQIVVIESMKMEIPVLSPVDGTVREIRVAEGEDVMEGQVIAVIG